MRIAIDKEIWLKKIQLLLTGDDRSGVEKVLGTRDANGEEYVQIKYSSGGVSRAIPITANSKGATLKAIIEEVY